MNNKDIINVLSQISYFSELDPTALKLVSEAILHHTYEEGQFIFMEGEPCIGLYVVEQGWARAVKISATGREQVIRFVGPGDVFNEVGVMAGGVNVVTVEAMEPVKLLIIQRDVLLDLVDQHPTLAKALIENLAKRVLYAMNLVASLSLHSVESRLARFLLTQAKENIISRIVVDYGDRRELVLLSRIVTRTGFEMYYDDMVAMYSKYFTVVKKYVMKNIKNLNELKELEEDNKEGFVIRFLNGFRVKVKFSEYVRLHGILTNVSNLTVWEHLRDNYEFDELLDRVPDEFYDWLKRTASKLLVEYAEIERQALQEFVRIYHINQITERALFAEQAKLFKHRSILFKLYDRKPYADIIWKQIRPVYSKPFKDGYEYVT